MESPSIDEASEKPTLRQVDSSGDWRKARH
nr:MAG TPA: hypothetical protein [Caudoviricetes sp.]